MVLADSHCHLDLLAVLVELCHRTGRRLELENRAIGKSGVAGEPVIHQIGGAL